MTRTIALMLDLGMLVAVAASGWTAEPNSRQTQAIAGEGRGKPGVGANVCDYRGVAEEALKKGKSAQNSGHLGVAIANFSEAIRLDPACVPAFIDRADVYGRKGDCDKAMADAAKAVSLDPASAMAHNALGVAALKSNPQYPDAFNNLGIVLARQGKYDEAIKAHKSGLAVRDDRSNDRNNLCRVHMQKGELEIKSGDVEAGNRDLDNALKENNLAIRCDPNFLGAWMSRMEVCFKRKDFDEARRSVERMVSIDPRARKHARR